QDDDARHRGAGGPGGADVRRLRGARRDDPRPAARLRPPRPLLLGAADRAVGVAEVRRRRPGPPDPAALQRPGPAGDDAVAALPAARGQGAPAPPARRGAPGPAAPATGAGRSAAGAVRRRPPARPAGAPCLGGGPSAPAVDGPGAPLLAAGVCRAP